MDPVEPDRLGGRGDAADPAGDTSGTAAAGDAGGPVSRPRDDGASPRGHDDEDARPTGAVDEDTVERVDAFAVRDVPIHRRQMALLSAAMKRRL